MSRIVRQREPLNLESRFSELDAFVTPADAFYVRNHFPVPEIAADTHELRISGAVENPFVISYSRLLAMPSVTIPATIECAGNGRAFLSPPAQGVQWERGAVGTAEWTGIPLRNLLAQSSPLTSAQEVVLEGADQGKPQKEPRPSTPIPFARSLPLEKALAPEVLVAFAMNGELLPPEHGFPVRAVVPGYYGMASVKWLTRIHVTDTPFEGYFQTTDYAFWEVENGARTRLPLRELMLKSLIAKPSPNEHIRAGSMYEVIGAAWDGASGVAAVEVSVDGGVSWRAATLIDPPRPFCWRRWRFEWQTPANLTRCRVMARAYDLNGSTQPTHYETKYEGYTIRHTIPIDVVIS